MMFADPELKLLEDKVVSTVINMTGTCDQDPEVEQQKQVIKECMREHHANLPFPCFTQRMTIKLSKNMVMPLNTFPPKIRISTTYSP